MNSFRNSLSLLAACLMVFVAGCGSDSSTGPGPVTPMNGGQAEMAAVGALDMTNAMVEQVPGFAEGNYGEQAQKNPTWDASESAWVWEYVLSSEEPGSVFTVEGTFWLQYRADGTPQQDHTGADAMEVRQTMVSSASMEDGGDSADFEFDFDTTLTVADLDTDVWALDFTGDASISGSQTAQGRSTHFAADMDWTVDLAMPVDGCATGSALIHADAYTMNATYNGDGTVDWTMSGSGYQSSGTDFVECPAPAAK